MKNESFNQSVYSTKFVSGKRTYFFDLKKTKTGDLYITITESRKKFDKLTGRVEFEKHKIFLYEEGLEDFVESLNEIIEKINENKN